MKCPLTLFIVLLLSFCVYGQDDSSNNFQPLSTWHSENLLQYEQRFIFRDTAYANAANRLAGLYRSMGSYEKAETLYLQALNIRERTLGKNHTDYAVSLNNLALLYKDMGNFSKAESLYLEAIEVIKNTFGKNHLSYATTLNNLATLYRDHQKFDDAESLYMEALTVFLNILGDKKHASHGITLNNLAVMFRYTGNFTASEPLQNKAIDIIGEITGKNHPSYATAINNMALLQQEKGNYSTAESLFYDALNIRKNIMGEKHPSYVNSLSNMSDFYFLTQNYEVADSLYKEANEALFYNIAQQFGFMSEKEKELYLKTIANRFDAFNTYSLARQSTNPSIIGETYNNTLKTKGLLLKSGTAMRNTILNSNNDELINNYKDWLDIKQQITQLTISGITEQNKNLNELKNQANKLEKKLVRHSTEFSDLDDLLNINWRDIKNNLKQGEAAIEFIHFKHSNDSILYCALILKHDEDYPVMIPVFEEKELEHSLDQSSENNYEYINSLYGKIDKPGNNLSSLIWAPLVNHLKNTNTIYLSPTGLLHKISFTGINLNKNEYLLDKYDIHILSTTAKAGISTGLDFPVTPNVKIFGGIQYSIHSDYNKPWAFLKGTLLEAETIKDVLKNTTNTSIISGTKATINNFKELAPKADILHIATHGFFFPDPLKTKEEITQKVLYGEINFRSSEPAVMGKYFKNQDPLMRSGLVFAGVNDYWTGSTTLTEDDGVLTAREVINIDLRNNQLAVMSACETGLGDIVGSEGVYGLQRAFKMAGTENMIISLWQIPDKETAEFMKTFYQLLIDKKDLYEAFSETQKKMRAKYDPFFWAGFVLTK